MNVILKNIFIKNRKYWHWTLIFCFSIIGCNSVNIYHRVDKNYGIEIDRFAKDFNLPAAYLKALIILESSANKNVQPRFEKHVYEKLIKVKQRKIMQYEGLTYTHLKNASNNSIKNLASSWGPFQIMGYKCIHLGVKVADLRGDSSIYWGIFWINKEYGNYLRQKNFDAAFRIHNTGRPNGKTYHTKYVQNGLMHISYYTN